MQQAASYASDSAAKYCIKGVANNNYKLNGQLEQTVAKVYKGADTSLDSLSLHGNRQKSYNQSGNKDLKDCFCKGEQGLSTQLLDEAATEVVTDPEERVNQEVEKAIRSAISKSISEAVQYALESSLSNMIRI